MQKKECRNIQVGKRNQLEGLKKMMMKKNLMGKIQLIINKSKEVVGPLLKSLQKKDLGPYIFEKLRTCPCQMQSKRKILILMTVLKKTLVPK
jgi:hypothetical protein